MFTVVFVHHIGGFDLNTVRKVSGRALVPNELKVFCPITSASYSPTSHDTLGSPPSRLFILIK